MSSPVSRRGMLAGAGVGAFGVAASVFPGASSARASASNGRGRGHGRADAEVLPGADVAHADGWSVFDGRRIGVITNPTGIIRDGLISIVDAMHASGTVDIGAVFGPEHGFRGTAQAGEAEETYVDERTGVTVYDAYGADANKFETFYNESGVDTIVFDIQDVGVQIGRASCRERGQM